MEPNRGPMGEFVSKIGPMEGGGVLKKSNGRRQGLWSANARSLSQSTGLPCPMSILWSIEHKDSLDWQMFDLLEQNMLHMPMFDIP